MPTEFADDEFKKILDYNKIEHAKAERMKVGEMAGRCFYVSDRIKGPSRSQGNYFQKHHMPTNKDQS